MSQINAGPVNITYGDFVEFVAQLFDNSGNRITPTSATAAISYLTIHNAQQTDSITLVPSGGNFIGTWPSTNAAAGLANWTITAAGVSSVAQNGVIRIIDEVPNYGLPLIFPSS